MNAPEGKIEAFRDFHARRDGAAPILGACTGGWESLSRYAKSVNFELQTGAVASDAVREDIFDPVYEAYVPSLRYEDGLVRCLEPMPSLPWAEAAFGCGVTFTGQNFWSSGEGLTYRDDEEQIRTAGPVERLARPEWTRLYEAIADRLYGRYGGEWPIGQAILRGPLDVAASVLGDENMIYAMYDQPDLVREILDAATEVFITLERISLRYQNNCAGGSVVGQYYIWTPGTAARLQNDAMTLLSPELYGEFVLPCDARIASVADFNLYHVHSTAFHLLDKLLTLDRVGIFQISKDEGRESIEPMLDGLVKLQRHGKCVVLKGRLDNDRDLSLIRRNLKPAGLCLQFVVESEAEADRALEKARRALT